MSLGPSLLLRDQFVRPGSSGGKTIVWSEVGLLVAPALSAAAVVHFDTRIQLISGLLTATSILTGLTFTMAMRFWERSIDARSDPKYIATGNLLHVVDKMRAHLVWTVFVGVVATGYLALAAVFVNGAAPVWSSAIMTFLCIYLVALVGGALLRFYELAYLLRP